jgi:hypothetical protein
MESRLWNLSHLNAHRMLSERMIGEKGGEERTAKLRTLVEQPP